jgi:hypothetical protein
MGARSAALAGSTIAWDFDGFAAYINPALLPMAGHDTQHPESRVVLSYGLIYMNPSFKDINNILVENKYISNADDYKDVDTSYKHTLGQEIGVSFKVFPEFHDLTLGVSLFFPIDQLAYADTGASYQPEYFLYRDRTQQPQVDFALGADLWDGFRLGVGLHTAYTLSGSAQAFLNTGSSPSTSRFSASLKPKLVPYFGLLYSSSDGFSAGVVFRLQASSDSQVNVDSGVSTAALSTTLPVSLTAASTLLYEPMSLEVGSSFKTGDDLRTYLQVDYQLWSRFQAPGLVVQNPSVCDGGGSCGVAIAPGPSYDYGYRNIVIPRIAEELAAGGIKYRLGYAYRPSILKNPPTEAGNYLDPDKHLLNAGASLEFQHFLGYDTSWRLDLNAAWQILVTQNIEKSPGDEAGNPGDSKIGSPGYQAGGSVWGGGASITFAF